MTKAVAYFRVSTVGQGRSGLGLEAQRRAVLELAVARGLTILADFTEVESGKRNDRPQLSRALEHARLTGAVLVIAKLDRLSRNASFLLALRDSGVRFLAADIPDANDVTIGVLAVIAQAEREAISRRTKEALAVVKDKIARGEEHVSRAGRPVSRLGNPAGADSLRARSSQENAARGAMRAADARAHRLAAVVGELRNSGVHSASATAVQLNRLGFLSPRGGRWYAVTAASLAARVARLKTDPDSLRTFEVPASRAAANATVRAGRPRL